MEHDSLPSSRKAPHAHASNHPPTPISETTPTYPPPTSHPPTPTPSTPLTSSPTSGDSLIGFDFSQPHDSSSESLESRRRIEYESSDSFMPYVVSYQLTETPSSVRSFRTRGFLPSEETHLELPDQDALDGGVTCEGFSTTPDRIRDAIVLEFPSTEEVVCEPLLVPVEEEPGAPPPCHDVTVPLELAAPQHELPGRERVTHSRISLPSQPKAVTPVSPTGNWIDTSAVYSRESLIGGNLSEPHQWDKVTVASYSDVEGGQFETGIPGPANSAAYNSQGLIRPPLKRHKPLVDDDFSKYSSPLATSQEGVRTTTTPALSSGSTIRQDSTETKRENTDQNDAASVRAKRSRKKALGPSLSLNLEDFNSDVNQNQARGHPQQRPQYSPSESLIQRPPFVVVNLNEGNQDYHIDSWDHSEIEGDPIESMKIEKDKWTGGDISQCHKPRPYRLESEHHGDIGVTVVNIIEEEEEEEEKKEGDSKRMRVNRSDESDASHDSNSNIKKGLKVKSVLYQVKEEANEMMDDEVNKNPKENMAKDCGHENPAYVDDEQDTVSQEENTAADHNQQEAPVEVARRRSNPECSVPGSMSEDIVRSHSYGNELDKVMNNLNGDEEKPVATPTLRKRSTSRGRPESQEGKENSNQGVCPSSSSKKDKYFVSFGPISSYGGEESSTSNIFQKLVNNPIAKLTRSESTKSHMGLLKSGREDGLARSISNIWEGGVKTKGSGSSHHGRPPQAPSSTPRDDHRHSQKNYILQQHLYRNSRRNVQQKLLRQLSDNYEDHRYNNNDFHHSRHDFSHKKHDSYHLDHHNSHGRHDTTSQVDRHHHQPQHHWPHGHHGRSQSQRHIHRPKHEPLRRLNTYGHEEYHKYVQEHEHRYEQEIAQAQAREQAQEHLQIQNQVQGEGRDGGEGGLQTPEEEAVRRISHYRQEEKGKTDVERWVGVHGDQPTEGTSSQPLLLPSPLSPGTPHIVVSPEIVLESNKNTQLPQADNEIQQLNAPGSNGPVFPNAQSTPAPPPTPANNTEERRLSMTTLDLPDGRYQTGDGTFRKTRRNSINEMHRRFGSQTNLQRSNSVNNIQRSNSRNSLAPSVLDWKQEGYDALIACLSALYGKLLVVMGMAFPTAEVISHDIPVTFYNGFYLYLYIGSIIFLVYAYLFLLHAITIPTEQLKSKFQSIRNFMTIPDISMVLPHRNTSKQEGNIASRDSRISGCSDVDKESDRASVNTVSYKTPKYTLTESKNHGSMYLKMGAVLFGIGSMIYSGLEVGQYFELKSDDNCADILLAISPAARMLFTFIQMYFIFLNSRVAISHHRVIARFGLMHMIGTNLCIWLNVLVQETKHEIINLTLGPGGHHGGELKPANHGATGSGHHSDSAAILGHHPDAVNDTVANNHTDHLLINDTTHQHNTHGLHDIHQVANDSHNIVRRSTTTHHALSIYECRRSDLMGKLVDEASPFLFPCTIEYSLLCAGVLYVIWKNINKPEVAYDGDSDISTYIARKARHHYSVDCAHANRGLFMGILVLVLTIISLILFFVLINNEAYKEVAILEANITELSVYGVASVTVIIGMIQMRELEFIPEGDIELDNILLLIAQSGVYIYTSFTVIGGHFTMTDNLILPLLSAIVTLLQTTLQTIFILDASRRCCYNQDQLERKPGREMVTFLLVCNLAMWAINTFETSRADAHPTQLNFYGIWAWTIISHISMPLAIFYRFHVTVCLCEIWKRSYKLRNDY